MRRMKYLGGRHACVGRLHVFVPHRQKHLPHVVAATVRKTSRRRTLSLLMNVKLRQTMGPESATDGQALCIAHQRHLPLRARRRHRVGRGGAKTGHGPCDEVKSLLR